MLHALPPARPPAHPPKHTHTSPGPKEKLDSTAVSQPAIYVASLAALEKLRAEAGEDAAAAADVAAGLSLGEYTALAYAGAFSFEDGLRLVKLRGESMQAAADAAPSGMVSVIGLSAEKVRVGAPQALWPRPPSAPPLAPPLPSLTPPPPAPSPAQVAELCEAANTQVPEAQRVQIANYLCNGNYAVSGGLEGCAVVEKIAKPDFKARWVRGGRSLALPSSSSTAAAAHAHPDTHPPVRRMTVKLAVAGAFHTAFMQPARERLQEALAATPIAEPRIPVVSNVDAQPHADPAVIKEILARQLTAPVQWESTLKALLERGLERSVEIGPNKVIAGIMKRVDKAHPIENVTA